MANNDLILILDDDIQLTLDDYDSDVAVLVDSNPYAPHYSEYTGPYEVTPILYDEQELRTNNKLMKDNVTVKPIPVVITSNPYDGKTVVIG